MNTRTVLPRCLGALWLIVSLGAQAQAAPSSDPYLWLEDVAGERALDWVRERNAATQTQLQAWPHYAATRDAIRAILDSRERIATVTRQGDALLNFWRDDANPRGLWRSTTLADYRKPTPAWQTLLDVDALARAEGENWVFKGADCLAPDYAHCLIRLSRGGADAVVLREFNLRTRRFVADGFTLPEAKSRGVWINRDEIFVATDFGPGSLTASGYARQIKRWRRGQPLAEARLAFEGRAEDVGVWVSVEHTPGHARTVFTRSINFHSREHALLMGDALQPLALPPDAQFSFWRERVLVELRSDLQQGDQLLPRGALLVAQVADLLRGAPRYEVLFRPSATRSLAGFSTTRDRLLLTLLDQVTGQLEERYFADGRWQARVVAAPRPGTLSVTPLHDPNLAQDALAEHYLLSYVDFLTPDRLLLGRAGGGALDTLQSQPAFFDSTGMRVEQRFAVSKDGTRIPYFVVWPRGAKADGRNPTLMYGYGGFRVSQKPFYSGSVGSAWLSRGGVYVVANIRGGGEFGPAWHQAALRDKRQNSFDDFAAVAEDLIKRGVTQTSQLGISGGSQGGLLTATVMLQRPELFGAVVSQVPLLDMQRYHRLLAGASWVAEYGDPDVPADWAFISRYSPYQNVKADAQLPPVLFTTSTRDDRVHPGHARKMAARMIEQGHRVSYLENIEGGHGLAADNAQRAVTSALTWAFLWQRLGGEGR